MSEHIQIPGAKWHQISLEPTSDPAVAPFTESLDVMGDGSLLLLATPGHTEGSVSLLIRRATRPPLLLVSDLTYGAELLERRQVPGVGSRLHRVVGGGLSVSSSSTDVHSTGLVQCVLGLYLTGSVLPAGHASAAATLNDTISRLDGAKMLVLAAMVAWVTRC